MGVTSVTLGSFFTTSNGKNVLGAAGGSGLDTQSIITALTTAQKAGATQDQTQVTLNNSKSSAFTQLQTLLSTFQTAALALSNPPGVSNVANNAFALTSATVGNGGSPYVSVATAAGATAQTYNVSDISSVATVANQGTGTFSFANANADATTGTVRFNPGTVTFSGGAQVTVKAGDSLNTIVANFNAVSSSTGISASIIQVDDSHYQISFASTKTGTNANFDLTNANGNTTITGAPSAVFANLGTAGATLTAATSATDAKFKVNGVQVDRQTNSVSDVINNVTFNILQSNAPDTTTNYPVTVSPDTTTIQNTIVSFVNAYNAIKTFQAQQNQLNSDGTYASTAVLVNDSTFQGIMNNINRAVNTQVAGILGSSDPSSLADVGVTFTKQAATSTTPEVDNLLTIDDGTLSSALASNFTGVKNLFGLSVTSSNPNFQIFSHAQPLGVTDFTVNNTGGVFTATYTLNGQTVNSPLTAKAQNGVNAYTLTGAAGSALDGATFIYGSSADATFSVHISQGIADQINSFSTGALKANTGSIAVAQTAIATSTTSLNKDIDNINTRANSYQTALIAKFTALEKAIASTNTLLQSLNANANAALTSSGH